jgi:crossover junction endodeoxyribonuclease RuvC
VRVLGIDPGTAACGYGLVDEAGGRLRLVESGCWKTAAREPIESRLRSLFAGVRELIEEYAPDAMAVEESVVGADARVALSVGQARGAILVAAATVGVTCLEYSPTRVKQAVCGYGRAEKGQIQRMVRMILSLETEPATHEADALAVAICHAHAGAVRRRWGAG